MEFLRPAILPLSEWLRNDSFELLAVKQLGNELARVPEAKSFWARFAGFFRCVIPLPLASETTDHFLNLAVAKA